MYHVLRRITISNFTLVADYIGLSNPKKRKADSMTVRYTSRNDYDESDDLDGE